MPKLDETILGHIRRTGPSTPIEVASKTGANSLIVTAVLIDAVGQKKIKQSKKKRGSMRYYYFPDQFSALQKRIQDILTPQDKEMIQRLMKENVMSELDVKPEEVPIMVGLEDLIKGFNVEYENKLLKCWSQPTVPEEKAREIIMGKIGVKKPVPEKKEEAKATLKEVKPEPKEVKPEPTPEVKADVKEVKKEKPKREEKKKEDIKEEIRKEILAELRGAFQDNVLHWLEKQEIDVMDEKTVKDGKEYELEVKVPTPLGKQTYILRIIDYGKKKASQDDVSKIGMDAISKRTPAIIISATGFAKTAIKYWKKELSDLVTLMSQDDLE